MSLRIEIYRVRKSEYGEPKYVAMNFAADFNLNGDPDHACMAAGNMIEGLAAMYAGDPIKVVVKLWRKRIAQWVGKPKRNDPFLSELAAYIAAGAMHRFPWKWSAMRAAAA